MIKTRSKTLSTTDFAPIYRVGKDGRFFPERVETQGIYQKVVPNFSRKPQPQPQAQPHHQLVQYQSEHIDELVDALLDDSTFEEQAMEDDEKPAVKRAHSNALGLTAPYEDGTSHQVGIRPSLAAMVHDNMAAFEANQQLDLQPSNMPFRTLRSKRSTRYGMQYMTRGGIAQGDRRSQLAASGRKRTMTTSDLSDSSATRMLLADTIDIFDIASQMRGPAGQDLVSPKLFDETPQRNDRKSMTGALYERPKEVTTVRRSKTTRSSRKLGLSKQKSVFKKMADALTGRLHLTHKTTATKAKESNSSGSVMNRFLVDSMPGWPTQEYETSIMHRVSERESPKRKTQPWDIIEVPSKHRSPRRSKSLTDDPFSDLGIATREPTNFVHRLKASSVSRPSWSTSDLSALDPFQTEDVLRGSLNSFLQCTPIASSTPRVRVHSDWTEDFAIQKEQKVVLPTFDSRLVLGLSLASDESAEHENQERTEMGFQEEDIDTHHLAPVQDLKYRAVSRAPHEKKHPSPSKVDLAILERQLRTKYPEALLPYKVRKLKELQESEMAKTKKHPSPRKLDIQMLGQQFRQLYPEVFESSTIKKSERQVEWDETDELAPSPTPVASVRPAASTWKVLTVDGFTRFEPPAEGRPRTLSVTNGCHSPPTMPDCACPGNDKAGMETDCPLHGATAEINELQWNDSAYNFVPRQVY